MTILLVCTANVCRSVYGTALLQEAILASDTLGDIPVSGAGTKAQVERASCDVVTERLLERGVAVPAHGRSRQLTESKIRHASLILTAERSHRSAVNQLVPGSQARTFTLLEASLLAEYLLADDERSEAADLDSVVEQLNFARGLATIPERKSRLHLPWSTETNALDIPDGHNISKRAHAATLSSVSTSIATIARFLEARLAPAT